MTNIWKPQVIDPPAISPVEMATTILLAGSMAIGANMSDVKQGTMSPGMAVLNGLAKGAASTLIFSAATRLSASSVVLAAGALAATGFAINHFMPDRVEKKIQRTDE